MTQNLITPKLAALLIIGGAMFANNASAAPSSCAFTSTANWAIPATQDTAATTLRVTGRSTGTRCANAGLRYTIINARGRVLFAQNYQASAVATFADVRTRTQMRAALADWIKPVNRTGFRANLPNWVLGADAPVAQEFGFIPAETMTREEYLGIKAGRTPMRCYVQGIESINCVIYHGGVIDPFGVQLFPG